MKKINECFRKTTHAVVCESELYAISIVCFMFVSLLSALIPKLKLNENEKTVFLFRLRSYSRIHS